MTVSTRTATSAMCYFHDTDDTGGVLFKSSDCCVPGNDKTAIEKDDQDVVLNEEQSQTYSRRNTCLNNRKEAFEELQHATSSCTDISWCDWEKKVTM